MPFFYDRISGESGVTQFMNYIENEIYIQDLKSSTKDVVNYQLVEVRRAISNYLWHKGSREHKQCMVLYLTNESLLLEYCNFETELIIPTNEHFGTMVISDEKL